MQSIAVLDRQMARDHAERSRALNLAAQRLVERLFGCWQHNLSRPFTRNGKTYRVCLKCGLFKDFDLSTWKTHGSAYASAPHSLSRH
jgi:hypothetical protein